MTTIDIGGHTIEIKRPDKVLFPDDGITKIELAEYYAAVSETMLPHVRERPLTVQRYPDGIDGFMFFQKSMPKYYPDWIDSIEVGKRGGGVTRYPLAGDVATPVYLASQAAITLHVWPSRADDLMKPDRLIIDLDPPDDDAFPVVRETARAVRAIFDEIGLVPYVMTTGSKGLHVVAPIRRADEFEDVAAFAGDVARVVSERTPDVITTEFLKVNRDGRLFFDTRRNSFGQHAVAPYSVRPKPGAPVATPIEWDELDDKKLTASTHTLRTIGKRLDEVGDPWKEIAGHARSLKGPRSALEQLLR